ncbi:NACHT domain-containing protein [Pectobacterium peruviense]|uniref:NACHT domain-containing protein n=1 Tax=Pectobacterium peruviense TaxID=2066479 RepID=UPI000DE4C3EB|nr:NACHT domain-containing protein [Pectobacterium peruviense]
MQEFTLEGVIAASLPWAKDIIKNKILPVIYSKLGGQIADARAERFLHDSLGRFLSKVKGHCTLVNTLAFKNTPINLLNIYEPMSIIHESEKETYECLINKNIAAIKDFNRILLTDSAGMGKSTILKRIVLDCIDQGIYIPFYIELRKIEEHSISTQIKNELGLSKNISDEVLQEIPFIYLFDGIDEIPQNIKSNVVSQLKKFSEIFSESKIVITSRHDGFLSELYGFTRFRINPLDRYQAHSLLRKYDNYGYISSRLINGLTHEEGGNLDEFLSTPLYVSLLFCAYKFKPIIPRKKELFYSQVFDALYESHDLTKELGYVREKFSGLDSTDFHHILRRLAFWCLKEGGKIEFTKDDLQIILHSIISKIPGLETPAALLVKDLVETVPLFVQEGAIVRWSHKSLMEYFAAMFICRDTKERQQEILIKLYKNSGAIRYKNLFELCADIDFSTFRASVIKILLIDYINLYDEIHAKSTHCKHINNKVEILFSGRKLIYIFDKKKESEKLTNLINGDLREFKELNSEFGYLSTSLLDISNTWIVIARSNTITEYILNILKSRNPEYFKKIQVHTYDEPEESIKLKQLVEENPETKIDISKETIILCSGECKMNLINYILSFDKSPKLKYEGALTELQKINEDESNGINQLLEGF